MSDMKKDEGPVIDMTPEGEFVDQPKTGFGVFLIRLAIFGLAVGAVALMFWTMLLALPILFVLGIIGYFAIKTRPPGQRPF